MTNGTPAAQCGNCHFARRQNGGYVECHHNSPVSDPTRGGQWWQFNEPTMAIWPLVSVEDWCGEYTQGP